MTYCFPGRTPIRIQIRLFAGASQASRLCDSDLWHSGAGRLRVRVAIRRLARRSHADRHRVWFTLAMLSIRKTTSSLGRSDTHKTLHPCPARLVRQKTNRVSASSSRPAVCASHPPASAKVITRPCSSPEADRRSVAIASAQRTHGPGGTRRPIGRGGNHAER